MLLCITSKNLHERRHHRRYMRVIITTGAHTWLKSQHVVRLSPSLHPFGPCPLVRQAELDRPEGPPGGAARMGPPGEGLTLGWNN